MADQDYIQKIVEELSAKLGIVQSEVIIALKELVKGKSNSEAVIILNQINIDTVMKSKTSGIISSYIKGNAGVLLGKEMFAQVQEKPLQALLDQSERYLAGEIASMGNVIKQEVINGVLNVVVFVKSFTLSLCKSAFYG